MEKNKILTRILSCLLVATLLLTSVVSTVSFTEEKDSLPTYVLGLETYNETVPVWWKYTTDTGYTRTQRVTTHYFRGAKSETPNDRSIVAYCMDWGVAGPENTLYDHKTTDISQDKINKLTSVIMNGYPYVKSYTVYNKYNVNRYGRSATFTDDGGQGTMVLQTATQIAVWMVMGRDSRGREMKPDGWVKRGDENNLAYDIMEIAYDLYKRASSNINWIGTDIRSTNAGTIDTATSSKIYGPFTTGSSYQNELSNNTIKLSLSKEAPAGTKILNSSKKEISSVKLDEAFYVSVPMDKSGTFDVVLTRENGMILPLSYEAQKEDRQRMFFSTLSDAITKVTISHKEGTSSLQIVKKENGATVQGVEFFIYYTPLNGDNSEFLGFYETDKNGNIYLQDLPQGYYDVYEFYDDTKYEVYVNGEPSPHGGTQATIDADDVGQLCTIEFENKRITKTSISLSKYDEFTGKPVEGAGFGLYPAEEGPDGSVITGDIIAAGLTDKNGDLLFYNNFTDKVPTHRLFDIEPVYTNGDLLAKNNTYVLVEMKTPSGYVTKENGYEQVTFVIDEDNINCITHLNVHNRPVVNGLTIEKVDDKNEPLAGANFALYHIDERYSGEETLVDTFVTDAEGKAYFGYIDGKVDTESGNALIYGEKYKLYEISAPNGYEVTTAEYIITPENVDGKTITQKVVNKKNGGTFTLTKTDEKDHNTKIPNTKFSLYKVEENSVLDFDGYMRSRTDISSRTFNKDGSKYIVYESDSQIKLERAGDMIDYVKDFTTDSNGIITAQLDDGEYLLFETKPAEGYKLNHNIIRFSINSSSSSHSFDVTNTPFTGSVTFSKIDSVSGEGVRGAAFTLFKKGATPAEDKVVDYVEMNEGETSFTLDGLVVGDYYFLETRVPSGYEKPDDEDTKTKTAFTISTEADHHDITYENVKIPSDIEIHKTDKITGKPIAGAKFELRKADGTVYKTAITDASGYAYFRDVEHGTYKLVETETAEGYDINSFKPQDVTVNGEAVKIEVGNNKITGDIKVLKVDKDTNKPLKDVEFKLFKADDEENALRTLKTDENGIVLFEDVEYGSYIIVETKTIEGYKIVETKTPVEIKEDKEYTFTIANEIIKRTIKLIKTDKDTKIPIVDVEFDVYALIGEEYVKYTTVKTDENGECTFTLPFGKYELRETKTGKGYKLSDETTKIDLTLEDIEDILSIEITNELISNTIILRKSGDKLGNYLKGAVYGLYNMDTDELIKEGTTDENGLINFGVLPYGSYYCKEITAPEGFDISNDKLAFRVDENSKEEQIIDAIDYSIPQTGYTTNTMLLVLLSTLSACLFIAIVVLEKKRIAYNQ